MSVLTAPVGHPPHPAPESRRRGQLYVLVAALAWSSAGALQRELSVDPAAQVGGRALFAALALLALIVVTERRGTVAAFRSMGRAGVAFAVLAGISSGTFMLALNHTTVADVLFMQALAPILAALLGWAVLREPVTRRTGMAMVVAVAGVALMVGGPQAGGATGLALSFVMTLSFAAAVVVARHRRDVSMVPATCLSQVLVVAAAAPFASASSAGSYDLALLFALGAGQIGLGLALLTVGARLIPPAEVALISLLEVVLGPLLVWLLYQEQPGAGTLAGGVVVLLAVLLQTAGDLGRPARRARAEAAATRAPHG